MDKIFKTSSNIDFWRNRRIKLLPMWMKLFFALQIALSFIVLFSIYFDKISPNFKINLYGFTTQKSLSFSFIFHSVLLVSSLISSILLIRGVEFGLKLGKLNYQIGIVICVIAFLLKIYFTNSNHLYFPIEIIPLFLILYKLKKIEVKWNRNFI